MKRLLAFVLLLGLSAASLYAQTPNLVVSAGPTGQAASLTVTSDSASPWKCFTVSGSAGAYNVIWAESNGTTGGIYFGTIAASSSGSAGPVTPPAPAADLPLGALTTAVSASLTTVDAATVSTVANAYESIGKAIDGGTIVSPLQLSLATSAQLLALTSDQLTAVKPFVSAVNGWIDAQQCNAKLTPDRMDKYAKTYHAIAQAVRGTRYPGTVTVTGVPPVGPPAAGASPCANGQCPASAMPTMQGWFHRWRQ